MRVIKSILIFSFLIIMGSCAVFQPRIPYRIGMSESKFLRQNRTAVISQLGDGQKVYRVNSDERFYLLVTFENGVLTQLEERELAPIWQQQRIMEENPPVNR
ncbi:hypothetical protein ADIS_1377 [Lunatimonas lonarensis]|uniref:Lipoprotein n=1 Tax=Lunatimonas lonarensis TaxID=1232681 RepID=R7ZVL4_9BACT|nr:hypothetical protein [Lunatimonas lonarensis]EON78180.1 hypothetical protein ADIS_1377 [Lunatimonas lonarensis]